MIGKIKKKFNWWRLVPYLHIDIQLPFFQISTYVMYETLLRDGMEYISLSIKLWKWKIEFRLYTTRHMRR